MPTQIAAIDGRASAVAAGILCAVASSLARRLALAED